MSGDPRLTWHAEEMNSFSLGIENSDASDKEAYLKATGHSITRGLHYFDVSLAPEARAELLVDRLDPGAIQRWRMESVAIPAGYSAAVVVERDVRDVLVYDVA